jgi:hypothetical protein
MLSAPGAMAGGRAAAQGSTRNHDDAEEGAMPAGRKFITHEFDEAIAIQRAIVDAERALTESHPIGKVKRQLKADLRVDRRHLDQLLELGHVYDATGKREEVAGALASLADETVKKAAAADSEAYEAHAVLLTLKRKQQDSAQALIKIARELDERDVGHAISAMKRDVKRSADALGKHLADFALRIALA